MSTLIIIYGRQGDGPVMRRVISLTGAYAIWGRFLAAILAATEAEPLVVGDKTVWSEVTE